MPTPRFWAASRSKAAAAASWAVPLLAFQVRGGLRLGRAVHHDLSASVEQGRDGVVPVITEWRMDYLRSLFGAFSADADDVEARCMLSFSLLIGNHFIAADHGTRSRADVLRLASRRLGV